MFELRNSSCDSLRLVFLFLLRHHVDFAEGWPIRLAGPGGTYWIFVKSELFSTGSTPERVES